MNHVPTNIRWHQAKVTAEDRERNKGQRGAVKRVVLPEPAMPVLEVAAEDDKKKSSAGKK